MSGEFNINGANTPWEKSFVSATTSQYLGGYVLWTRLMNGQHFFALEAKGYEPMNGITFGYHTIADAVQAKGLL